jgi:hypothetical protein
VRPSDGADAETASIASEYLARAGVQVGSQGHEVRLPSSAEIELLAGDPLLVEAARALAGALAAVEAVKAILEIGTPLRGAPQKLSSEDV